MTRQCILFVIAAFLNIATASLAQEQPPSQPPPAVTRVEARKEVVVNWTLGDQMWLFKDILMTYEPVRGYLEPGVDPVGRPGTLAVWKLRTARDLEEGTVRLHEQMRGSPFKVVLLDEDRLVVNPDAPAQITLPSGRAGDTIELRVALPDTEPLKQIKSIRVERRTDVGF